MECAGQKNLSDSHRNMLPHPHQLEVTDRRPAWRHTIPYLALRQASRTAHGAHHVLLLERHQGAYVLGLWLWRCRSLSLHGGMAGSSFC
jgi:hypothetical protein